MSENKILSLLIILFALFLPGNVSSQIPVPVEVSKQKIVVEGKIYYMHPVLKGQTLYSISKAYNIPIDVITRENSIPDTGIKEGQMLKIPASNEVKIESKAKTKTEVKAEDKADPVNTTQPQSQPQPQIQPGKQEEQYIYHKVSRGETLSSIADQYNVSVRELKKANKGLLFPEEGEYLMIPGKRPGDSKPSFHEPQKQPEIFPDTLYEQVLVPDSGLIDEEADTIVFNTERTSVSELRGNLKVAVMLPFFLRENSIRSYTDSSRFDSKGKRIFREVSLPADYLYEGSVPFIEIYEGILLAVDSLRTLGLGIEMDVYDTEIDTGKVDMLIASGKLENVDLIIGPVFSFNLSRVAEYAADKNIPVVSPVHLRDQNILDNRPTLFRICPSHAVSQDVMIKEIISRKNCNVVFLYADSLMLDPQTELFWNKLTHEIDTTDFTGNFTLSPYFVMNLEHRSSHQQKITSIESLLMPDRENIVIITSTETPVVSSVFSTLHSLEKKYPIKVMGYSEIAFLPTIDLRYYYDMELFTPVESYIDFDDPLTTAFTKSYLKRFGTEPTRESFAWRGFDLAYFFISGIALEGKSFVKRPWKFNPLLVSHDVRFSRENRHNGFENIGMFTLRYNKDMTVTVTSPEEMSRQNARFNEPRY